MSLADKTITVIGPDGGIGGYIAARVAKAINTGVAPEWTLNGLARSDETVRNVNDHGLIAYDENPELPGQHNRIQEQFFVTNNASDLGPQDVIICATPASSIPFDQIGTMTKPGETLLIPCVNGVPFWYPKISEDVPASAMASVDPDGKILSAFEDLDVQLVGAVMDVAGIKVRPGEVEGHPAFINGSFIHGEVHLAALDGEESPLLQSCIELFNEQSGIRTNALKNREALLRQVWVKLAGNVAANYGAAMYDKALPELLQHEGHGPFLREAMIEILRVGFKDVPPQKQERLLPRLADKIIKAKSQLAGHFTSTHASYASGDGDCESSVIIKPARAIAAENDVPTPNVDIIAQNFANMMSKRDELHAEGQEIGVAARNARLEIIGPA